MAMSAQQSLAVAFNNDQELQQFMLAGVTPTGKVLGTGSYGSVEEVSLWEDTLRDSHYSITSLSLYHHS